MQPNSATCGEQPPKVPKVEVFQNSQTDKKPSTLLTLLRGSKLQMHCIDTWWYMNSAPPMWCAASDKIFVRLGLSSDESSQPLSSAVLVTQRLVTSGQECQWCTCLNPTSNVITFPDTSYQIITPCWRQFVYQPQDRNTRVVNLYSHQKLGQRRNDTRWLGCKSSDFVAMASFSKTSAKVMSLTRMHCVSLLVWSLHQAGSGVGGGGWSQAKHQSLGGGTPDCYDRPYWLYHFWCQVAQHWKESNRSSWRFLGHRKTRPRPHKNFYHELKIAYFRKHSSTVVGTCSSHARKVFGWFDPHWKPSLLEATAKHLGECAAYHWFVHAWVAQHVGICRPWDSLQIASELLTNQCAQSEGLTRIRWETGCSHEAQSEAVQAETWFARAFGRRLGMLMRADAAHGLTRSY